MAVMETQDPETSDIPTLRAEPWGPVTMWLEPKRKMKRGGLKIAWFCYNAPCITNPKYYDPVGGAKLTH